MITLLLLLAGLASLIGAVVGVARYAAHHEKRRLKVATRLQALRPLETAIGSAHTLFGPESGPQFLRVRFARADLHLERRTAGLALAAILGVAAAALWLGRPLVAVGVVGLAVAAALPVLELLAGRNVAILQRELPFLLDSVRQHLNVGASLQQSMIRAVDQAGPGVGRHFAPAMRRMQNGATLVESLTWLAARLDVPEVDMLGVAIQTNTRFGGAMSPTLLNLSQILRDRARVARELKGATAETRLSGWILAGLPVLAIAIIVFVNPSYSSFLIATPTGHGMLAFAVGLQALGCVLMGRIMRLDF